MLDAEIQQEQDAYHFVGQIEITESVWHRRVDPDRLLVLQSALGIFGIIYPVEVPANTLEIWKHRLVVDPNGAKLRHVFVGW